MVVLKHIVLLKPYCTHFTSFGKKLPTLQGGWRGCRAQQQNTNKWLLHKDLFTLKVFWFKKGTKYQLVVYDRFSRSLSVAGCLHSPYRWSHLALYGFECSEGYWSKIADSLTLFHNCQLEMLWDTVPKCWYLQIFHLFFSRITFLFRTGWLQHVLILQTGACCSVNVYNLIFHL